MSEESEIANAKQQSAFCQDIGLQAARKLKARDDSSQGVWFGLGTMGLIGWSVVIPTLLGAWLGVWLDKSHPSVHSWTLTMLVAGLAVGCLDAWHWVSMENEEISNDQEGDNE